MIVDDQQEIRAFLSEGGPFGSAEPVTLIETHISLIALAGKSAFKLKRAVQLPYLDFSTPDFRLSACESEVALNSLTAPGLYRGVHRVTRDEAGALRLGGEGRLVDALIEMARFDQDRLFDRMAVAGRLTPALITQTARMIARVHRTAPVSGDVAGTRRIGDVLSINEAGFATSRVFSADEVERLSARFRSHLLRHADRLDRRAAAGKVRRCHGDLHLRNICLLEDEPRLFDCIEFNAELATTDVLYDLAFLLMDLWHRGFADLANLTMNRYLDDAEEDDGVVLLPFLMAIRAAVRAHVTATQVAESWGPSEALVREARSYFALADALLATEPPRLVAIGGLSGSGKTTVADRLAPRLGVPPGARLLESDRIRKSLFDVPAETRLPQAAYAPDVSQEVYREIALRAGVLLSAGACVVADAVFDKPENRARMADAAHAAQARFTGIWLAADTATLHRRVRERAPGPSDATVDVLARQLDRLPQVTDWRHLKADEPVEALVEAALKG
ncbi:hypothetical protein SAMN05880590_101773 [Rhizobium sp. RU35A]|uniref:bifunctional aminoglycoside phosphotransferase/ATP-binding protein n=1 Tax=Rhizobium sp. RU35A TaxID=1907414 RepID=UPI00095598FF|nr:bifunctional aminoglycoside phosphotransferase/ATP-binding protein [Rhizobium sp. RU35A]SIQ01399.1 hypothetical protein SAMN05880590_101773 [Rhizobium sp. RU35A]